MTLEEAVLDAVARQQLHYLRYGARVKVFKVHPATLWVLHSLHPFAARPLRARTIYGPVQLKEMK